MHHRDTEDAEANLFQPSAVLCSTFPLYNLPTCNLQPLASSLVYLPTFNVQRSTFDLLTFNLSPLAARRSPLTSRPSPLASHLSFLTGSIS